MSQHNANREAALSRRHALAWITATGTTALYVLSAAAGKRFSPFNRAEAAAIAHDTPVIPVIVKDTTSFYWQTVITGARKAGQDLGIKIVELGAQSDSDANGQISLLEIAVASNPTVLVLAPAQFAALRRPIDEAAKKVKIIGIDSDADSAAFTSMVATDNVQAGRIAADILADRIKRTYADAEGDRSAGCPGPLPDGLRGSEDCARRVQR
jgi:ABC-type sugar transport system substrate-binding protein